MARNKLGHSTLVFSAFNIHVQIIIFKGGQTTFLCYLYPGNNLYNQIINHLSPSI